MADTLQSAVALVDRATTMPQAEAVRYLSDQYRAAQSTMRDAIVLALIGQVVTAAAFGAARPNHGGTL